MIFLYKENHCNLCQVNDFNILRIRTVYYGSKYLPYLGPGV